MSTTNFHAVSLSTALLCLAGALSSGCHHDIVALSTGSATDDDDFFATSDPDPTTSGGDPTDGGVDPSDFCKLHPGADYPGIVHVCSGMAGGAINFDYFGDPDLPLHSFIPCEDRTAPPFEETKPAGYVYSCFVESGDFSFGPSNPQPNGHQIDACCVADSPEEAVGDYCRIDGAEELCLGTSDGLNALRAEIPHVAALAELHQQLENLNKFLADTGSQTDCAKSVATGLLEAGDFSGSEAKAGWHVEHPQELDPGVGWPWFRELRLNVYDFQIDAVESSGVLCDQLTNDAVVVGVVDDGQVSVEGAMGAAETVAAGAFSFRRSECDLASCEFSIDTLELQLKDFGVGSLQFSDLSLSLSSPSIGLIEGDRVSLAEHAMHLAASFRLTSEGRPMFDGAPVSVGFRNAGVARFRLRPDATLGVEALRVVRWPFEFALVSQVSP